MADEAQGAAAPAITTEPAAPPDAPRVRADELPPEALKARLEAEAEKTRRAVLAELGVQDTKDAKAALAELKRRQDAERSDLEKANARVTELEGEAMKAKGLEAVIANRAAAEVAALNEKARAFVTAEAGADPAKQLATIDRMRATGLLDAAAAAAAPTIPAPAPVAPPTTTSPRPAAPPDSSSTITVDHRAEYERLMKENPFVASAYAARHQRDVFVRK